MAILWVADTLSGTCSYNNRFSISYLIGLVVYMVIIMPAQMNRYNVFIEIIFCKEHIELINKERK